jgi:hypothetical protein
MLVTMLPSLASVSATTQGCTGYGKVTQPPPPERCCCIVMKSDIRVGS